MPYTPTSYTTGGTATAANLDNGETQYTEATLSFEQDLFTSFVFSGLVATKDGTTLSQLDVTAGVAFLRQSSDSTLRRRAPNATTFSASGHATSTLYLDLQPDGTWSWGTAHSAQSGYLPIAQVTTDGSSNIATVADERTLTTTLLSGMAGDLTLPNSLTLGKGLLIEGGSAASNNYQGALYYAGGNSAVALASPLGGASNTGIYFAVWDGSTTHIPFSIGGQYGSASAWIDDTGSLTVSAGGKVSAPAVYDNSARVTVVGAHSTGGQPALSFGSGAPAALASNEIYFQVS